MMFCDISCKVWYLSPLRLDVTKVKGGTVRDWVASLELSKKEDEWWALFWLLCWSIWLGRNAWVFEGVLREPRVIIEKAVQGMLELGRINDAVERRVGSLNYVARWTAPMEGVYKLNSDAAMFGGNQIGLGSVVCDFEGDVMMAMCDRMNGITDVALAEALSARNGIKLALEAGFVNLVLEVDNWRLYKSLKDGTAEPSQFGSIIRDIRQYAVKCSHISFSHVRRLGNSVAHCLAKLSNQSEGLLVWLEDYPSEIASLVSADKFHE